VTSGVAETTQTDAAVMANTAAKFNQVNESLQSMLSTLMNELSVLSSAWQGQGGRAFEQVKERYAQDLKTLNRALSETSESIKQSGSSYHASDDASASRVANSGGDYSLPL
jgi:WXG100 family type VII secretion target